MRYRERQSLIAEAISRRPGIERLPSSGLQRELAGFIAEKYRGSRLGLDEKRKLTQELIDAMRGLDILEALMRDPEITEIMVNAPDRIFVERSGIIEQSPLNFDDSEHLKSVLIRCFGRANRLLNEQRPIASLRFPDGSRLQAMLPPASPLSPAMSLRRFTGIRADMAELVKRKSLTEEAAEFLCQEVRRKQNIFISGGTGSGKTTFLNALSTVIPPGERIVTIEDTLELRLPTLKNVLRLEAREAAPDGKGAISLEDLIRSALRLRPDRIIVGEVRGHEAYAMLEAMQSGHPGSMSTGHANSPEAMLERLALLLLLRCELPWSALLRMLCGSLDYLVQLERSGQGRRQLRGIYKPMMRGEHQIICLPIFERENKDANAELRRVRPVEK